MGMRQGIHRIHVAAFLFAVANYLHGLVVPLYAVHLEYSPLAIGLFAGLPYVVQLGFRVTAGVLADHYGDVRVLRIGSLLYLGAPAGLLLSAYATVPALLLAQVMMGIGHTVFWTISKAYVTKLPSGSGAAHISLFNGVINAGKLLGLLGAGTIASFFGYERTFLSVLFFVILFIITIYSLPSVGKPAEGKLETRRLWQFMPPGVNAHGLFVAGFFAFIGGTAISLASTFFSVYLRGVGYSEATVSLLAPMVMLGTLLASVFMSRLLDRITGSPPAMVAIVLLQGAAIVATPFFRHWLPLSATFLLTGFAGGAGNIMSQKLVQLYSPPKSRGASMAFSTLFLTLAQLVWPWAIGLLATATSIPLALWTSGSVLMGVGAVFALGGHRLAWLLRPAATVSNS